MATVAATKAKPKAKTAKELRPKTRNPWRALSRAELKDARKRMDNLIERETGYRPSVNIKNWLRRMADN